jgi:hypothetical protein
MNPHVRARLRAFALQSVLSSVLLTAACAKAEPPMAAAPAAPPVETPAQAEERVAEPSQAPAGGSVLKATQERMVIHRAELALSSDDVARTADAAAAVVERAKGYVASRDEQHTGSHVTESALVLRVPAPEFDRVLAELKHGNDVVRESLSGQDVTAEYTDNAARLRAQRVLEERLLALSTSQQALKDLLEVERELLRVRSEIERLLGAQQLLENQSSMGTISLTVRSPVQPVVSDSSSVGSQLANAVEEGLETALEVTTALIRVLLAFLPFLPLPVFAYLLFRMRRRRLLSQGQA